jgi:hypothetical protein
MCWSLCMAIANFEQLCAGFCEVVAVPPPALRTDNLGLTAFHVILRGETVNLVHRPKASADHVFVLFELGPLPDDATDPLGQITALLDANFALLQLNAPMFSRNPQTGDVLLQYIYPLFEATPAGLYELIDLGIESVESLRASFHARIPDDPDRPAAGPLLDLIHRFA